MATAHVLMHVAAEGPGRLADLLTARGLTLREWHLFAALDLPTPQVGDLLLVMGGPMGVGERNDPRFPFLEPEIALIRRCIDQGIAVLGICLGSQLLAHAAGATVHPNIRPGPNGQPQPAREVGWAPVAFHDVDHRPELRDLHRWEWMLHWHGDTFTLPAGAVLLASTPVTPHQAFRLERAIGLQFHPEADAATIANWLRLDRDYAELASGPDAVDHITADTARLLAAARPAADRLLDNCLDVLLRP